MNDPTRIDRVLAALRDAWEGQPELPLATLFAQLANAGYGWGTSDEHLLAALAQMAACHPPQFPPAGVATRSADAPELAGTAGVWFLRCQAPDHDGRWHVTVDAGTAVVQYFRGGRSVQPVVWRYDSIRPTGPSRPLVITDEEGFEHRLGIIESIDRLDVPALRTEALTGRVITPKTLGEYEYIVRCEGATLRVGARLEVFEKTRRELHTRRLRWRAIGTCRVGEPFVFLDEEGAQQSLGSVREVLIVQAPSRRWGGLDA